MIVNVPKDISYLTSITYSSNGLPQMVYSTSTNMVDITQMYGSIYQPIQSIIPTEKFWTQERFIQFLERLPGRVFLQPSNHGYGLNILFERLEDQTAFNQIRERYKFDLKTSVKEDLDEIKDWLDKISYDRKDINSSVSGISKITFRDHEDAVAFKLKFTDIVREL